MREITRNRMTAVAKSRRAAPAELKQARERIKEIDAELKHLELQPETKKGEEREKRYERILRLRAMRDEFQSKFPVNEEPRPNSLLLALVMTVTSFLICSFCAGGSYFAYAAINQKPDPVSTAQGFWADMQAQNYNDIHANFLAPTLRVALDSNTFDQAALQSDASYGTVTGAILTKKPTGDLTQSQAVQLTYTVTRSKVSYSVTLDMEVHLGQWGITNLSGAIDPTQSGVPAVATPTPYPSPTPTDTPTVIPNTAPTTSPTGQRQAPITTF
ncbi:MAG: hypothetical protein ABI068_09845 [Ktedonobacterales bacterium]